MIKRKQVGHHNPNKDTKRSKVKAILRIFFWFTVGVSLGFFLFISFAFILFQKLFAHAVYPGILVAGIEVGGKTQEEIEKIFAEKNARLGEKKLIFTHKDKTVATTAETLGIGFDGKLLALQAYSVGRSNDPLSNGSLIFQAYLNGIYFPASYTFSENTLKELLDPIAKEIYAEPVEALFSFENGRVITFRPSQEGQELDMEKLKKDISTKRVLILTAKEPQAITIPIPVKILKPKITTDKVNNLGIEELIGSGTSLYRGSIATRTYNISLAASRINGVLVAPDEIFSFNKVLGDISEFTGYKQAYIIQNGRTVLGDGGGVCQVSTTFFRAVLNAGLPIVERNAHAYRVAYYEQDSPPGFDATIYVPSVDFRFKNDTGKYILIQSVVDQTNAELTFNLYGTSDGREVTLSKPAITNQIPAPEPLYQDDPTLPKGEVKQVDFAAAGAIVVFTREVKKNGKTMLSDKFVSNYRPWQAVYLRGTKEN
ncbi:MAG: VanW family protein [Candidatus Levybacteria bacterium]|nr:VanW family protein [Candidatus Levybacteria bacterium]